MWPLQEGMALQIAARQMAAGTVCSATPLSFQVNRFPTAGRARASWPSVVKMFASSGQTQTSGKQPAKKNHASEVVDTSCFNVYFYISLCCECGEVQSQWCKIRLCLFHCETECVNRSRITFLCSPFLQLHFKKDKFSSFLLGRTVFHYINLPLGPHCTS